MQKMIAKENFPYGLNEVKTGDWFDAHPTDVEVLEHVGFAKRAGKGYQTRMLTADNEAKQDPVARTTAVKSAS